MARLDGWHIRAVRGMLWGPKSGGRRTCGRGLQALLDDPIPAEITTRLKALAGADAIRGGAGSGGGARPPGSEPLCCDELTMLVPHQRTDLAASPDSSHVPNPPQLSSNVGGR